MLYCIKYLESCIHAHRINKSASFRFLQRLSVILGFRRDFRELLLPVETVIRDKYLPAEPVGVVLLGEIGWCDGAG